MPENNIYNSTKDYRDQGFFAMDYQRHSFNEKSKCIFVDATKKILRLKIFPEKK